MQEKEYQHLSYVLMGSVCWEYVNTMFESFIGARVMHDLSTRSKAYFLAGGMVEQLNGTWKIRSTA